MIRYAWIGLLVALAFLAAGAQLDRQARRTPMLAPVVPQMFRSFSQARLVLSTVRSADPAEALKAAQLLVQRRPIPAEHLSLLAIATVRNGDNEKAFLLLQKAAQRGWRDSVAQQTMLEIATKAGDLPEATRRLAALWGMGESQMPLAAATAKLMASADGRKAMAATMANNGRWMDAFLAQSGAVQPEHLAETLALAARQGARFECSTLQRIESVYTRRKLDAEAGLIAEARKNCVRGVS
ncbi:hypothetical protein [Novosphingobium sp. AAP83]|uniref:hypothetical protein n=1 Tax=Novosphingobium sp. AAP83 TaxID=1523425 RepID=UPI0006B9B3E6|nr:hypothetical protein [Novosphingobium sp. AAP83]